MHGQRHGRGRGSGRRATGVAIQRFLEPCLLLLLHRGASYGYELVNALKPFGFGDVARGPVYRVLREFESAGLVKSEWDTDSTEGPARRVYSMTEDGHQCLADWVKDLRKTKDTLQTFLDAYDRHVNEDAEK